MPAKPVNPAQQKAVDKAFRERLNLKGNRQAVAGKRDPIEPSNGHRYMCLSYVCADRGRVRSERTQIKVRGTFQTEKEAQDWCEKIHTADPDFDVWVVDMFEWIPIPFPQEIQTGTRMKYDNPQLDDIMGAYYDRIENDRKELQKRVDRNKVAASAAANRKAAAEASGHKMAAINAAAEKREAEQAAANTEPDQPPSTTSSFSSETTTELKSE